MTTVPRPPAAFFPTAVAAAALASVLWLLLVSAGFGLTARARHNEEDRIAKYYQPGFAPQKPVDAGDVVMLVVLIGSAVVSLGLIVAAFCFWSRHLLVGKVLTVASSVLFLPFLCCGILLGAV